MIFFIPGCLEVLISGAVKHSDKFSQVSTELNDSSLSFGNRNKIYWNDNKGGFFCLIWSVKDCNFFKSARRHSELLRPNNEEHKTNVVNCLKVTTSLSNSWSSTNELLLSCRFCKFASGLRVRSLSMFIFTFIETDVKLGIKLTIFCNCFDVASLITRHLILLFLSVVQKQELQLCKRFRTTVLFSHRVGWSINWWKYLQVARTLAFSSNERYRNTSNNISWGRFNHCWPIFAIIVFEKWGARHPLRLYFNV